MSDMTYAYKVMASLLLEAELKEVLPNIQQESVIRLVLKDKSEKTFFVESNLAGRVIMVDKSDGKEYTFTKDAISDGTLTIYKYEKNSPSGEGAKIVLKVEEFSTAKKGGEIKQVDIVKPIEENRLEERMNEMNDIIKTAKKGSIINIASEEKIAENDGITNNIFLRVNEITPKKLSCTLEDINSDGESTKIKTLLNTFKNRNIYISINSLVKIKNNDLVLNLYRSDRIVQITGLLNIEVGGGGVDNGDSDYTPMSKQELIDKIKSSPHSKEYLEAMDKTPDFWDTLMNASPKGVNQLNQILDKEVTKNSYLTVGRQIQFEIISGSVIVDNNIKLLNTDKFRSHKYPGKIEKGNIIISGRRRSTNGHWELKILKDLGDGNFKVRVSHCDMDLNCKIVEDEGAIRIVE